MYNYFRRCEVYACPKELGTYSYYTRDAKKLNYYYLGSRVHLYNSINNNMSLQYFAIAAIFGETDEYFAHHIVCDDVL